MKNQEIVLCNPQVVLCNPQETQDIKGMLFVRIIDILNSMIKAPLILFGLLLAVVLPVNSFGSTLRAVDFVVYPDGTTHISHEVLADHQSAEVTIQLFGSAVENFVAQDGDGLLLSYQVIGDTARIDTFGATSIFVSYDSYDLVTKDARVWTFKVESPVGYTITLPQNTVIVGMTSIPESVLTVDEQPRLSLPSGNNEIDYFFGITGRGAMVGSLIAEVNETVTRLGNQGITISAMNAKLDEARKALDERRYDRAELLANEVKALAQAAELAANNSTDTNPMFLGNMTWMTAAIAALAGAVGVIVFIAKRRGAAKPVTVNANTDDADPDEEYADSQQIREDDKRLVEFLVQNGGQAYERDLRKKFLLPRTTMWRAVKRLERQGIIEIEKKDFQNLVKLRKEGEQ